MGRHISLRRVDEVFARVKHLEAGAAPNQPVGRLKMGWHSPERKRATGAAGDDFVHGWLPGNRLSRISVNRPLV